MAMTGIVTITMEDIYKMPTSQKDKYLTLCKTYNDEVQEDIDNPELAKKKKELRLKNKNR